MADLRGTEGSFFGPFADWSRRWSNRSTKGPREVVYGEAHRIPRDEAGGHGAHRLRRLERLAWLLDHSVGIGRFRFGLDPIIGLLPGAGDWIGAVLSTYVLYEGARMGIRGPVLVRMAGNVLLETLVGMIPFLGDLFDFAWKANTKNLALIRQHYQPEYAGRSLKWVGLTIAVFAALVLIGALFLSYLLLAAIIKLFGLEHVFG